MKRRPRTSRITEQATPASCAPPPDTPKTPAANLYSTPLQLKRGHRVSYVAGELPKEEPPDAPRLFIRGLGGSIKMDLGGVGVPLSPAAFAYHVPDDSLANLHIHRGDIVLIEPHYRAFRVGNLILLEIDGRAVLRRLTRKKRVWYLNATDPTDSAPVPLTDQPLQGVATGFVRLFSPPKPVKFRGTDTSAEISFMRSGNEAASDGKKRAAAVRHSLSKTRRAKPNQSLLMLAAEKQGKFRLSEVEKKSAYNAWPNTR